MARANQTTPTDSVLTERIGLAWRELRRGAAMNVLRDQLYGTGADALDPGQMDTLDLLVKQEHWRMCDLAEALRVEPSTATRAVQRLVAFGLAERRPSKEDGRVVLVSATQQGHTRHEAVLQVRLTFFSKLLDQLSPAEAARIASALESLVAGIDIAVANLQEEHGGG